jgi:hypothetical protein
MMRYGFYLPTRGPAATPEALGSGSLGESLDRMERFAADVKPAAG